MLLLFSRKSHAIVRKQLKMLFLEHRMNKIVWKCNPKKINFHKKMPNWTMADHTAKLWKVAAAIFHN